MHEGKLFVCPRDVNGKDGFVFDIGSVHRYLGFSSGMGAFDLNPDVGLVRQNHAPVAQCMGANRCDADRLCPRVDDGPSSG